MSNHMFFTSDTHFGHANIIKYCDRPFSSVEEMDEVLIQNWNSVVKPDDTVYHLGDVAFYKANEKFNSVINRLNGYKLLVMGNHDSLVQTSHSPFYQIDFRVLEITRDRVLVTCSHFPHLSWAGSHRGAFNLHGHMHSKTPISDKTARRYDVGVDANNYTPVAWEDIKAALDKIPSPKSKRARED